MDIRGRCDPVLHPQDFSKCPCRVDTTYFHITNTIDEYNQFSRFHTEIELGMRSKRNKIVKKIAKGDKYKLTPDECEDLLELFENDDQWHCECCSHYIPIDEEGGAVITYYDDALVCEDCAPITICEGCDAFNYDHDSNPYEEYEDKFYCEDCREELDETDNEEDE